MNNPQLAIQAQQASTSESQQQTVSAEAQQQPVTSDAQQQTVSAEAQKPAPQEKITITEDDLQKYLGNFDYEDLFYIEPPIGVSLGLGYNPHGGSVLAIESLLEVSPSPSFELTGRLGEVMKESAHIAHSFSKSFLDQIAPGHNLLKQVKPFLYQPSLLPYRIVSIRTKFTYMFLMVPHRKMVRLQVLP